MTRRLVSFSLLLFDLAFSSLVRADDARGREAAERLFRAAVRQSEAGDPDGARVLFAQSLAALPTQNTLRNLASVEARTGHCAGALKHLQQYLKGPLPDPLFVQLEVPRLTDTCNRVGHVQVTAPPQAEVQIDGQRVADLSEPVDVTPGPHSVSVRATGYSDAKEVTAHAGQTVDVSFDTSPPPPEDPGLSQPTRPPEQTETRRVELPPPLQLESRSPSFWSTRRVVGASVAAAGLASLAVSVVFLTQANQAKDDAEGLARSVGPTGCRGPGVAPQCGSLQAKYSTQDNDATLSDVTLGVAAGALAVGAVLFAWPLSKEPAQARVVPVIASGGWGLALQGVL